MDVRITELRFKAWPDTLYGHEIGVNDQRNLFQIMDDLKELGVKFHYQYISFFGRIFLSGLYIEREGLVAVKDKFESLLKDRYLEVVHDNDWVLSSTGDPGTVRSITIGTPYNSCSTSSSSSF